MVKTSDVIVAYLELQFIDTIETLLKQGLISFEQAEILNERFYEILCDIEETIL